jgi:hypothetical protein
MNGSSITFFFPLIVFVNFTDLVKTMGVKDKPLTIVVCFCCLHLDFPDFPPSSSHFWSITWPHQLLSFDFFFFYPNFVIWNLALRAPRPNRLYALAAALHYILCIKGAPRRGWEFFMSCSDSIIWHNDQDRLVTAGSPAKEASPVHVVGVFAKWKCPVREVIRK